MPKDIIGILSIRDKLHRILSEPTLDNVYSAFASVMLGVCFVSIFSTYSDQANITFIRENANLETLIVINVVPIVSFLLASLSGAAAAFYEWKHEPILKQKDERRKTNKKWDYLYKNKHLEAVDIKLEKIDSLTEEMNYFRKVLASISKYIIEIESTNKNDEDITKAMKKTQQDSTSLPSIPSDLAETITAEIDDKKQKELKKIAELASLEKIII